MSAETLSQLTTFGYLSTLESPEHGYFGGYLIVSGLGRPVEFHCTAPVRPGRAQQILYGPTLQAYLFGEQIGGKLIAAAKMTPRIILSDQVATLSIRARIKVPMALVVPHDSNSAGPEFGITDQVDASNGISCNAIASSKLAFSFALGTYDVHLPVGFEADRPHVFKLLTTLAECVDLSEPFGRIHDAIREAQRISGRSNDDHRQAA